MSAYMNDNVNDSFRKELDAGKPHVRNSVRDTSGNGCIYSTHELSWLKGSSKDGSETYMIKKGRLSLKLVPPYSALRKMQAKDISKMKAPLWNSI